METKKKGGRLPASKQFIFDKRASLFKELVRRGWTKVDIGILFNVDATAVPRVLKTYKK